MKRILILVTFFRGPIRKFAKTFNQKWLLVTLDARQLELFWPQCVFSLQNEVVPRRSPIGCIFGFVQSLGLSSR